MRRRAKVWKYCGLDITDVSCQGDVTVDRIFRCSVQSMFKAPALVKYNCSTVQSNVRKVACQYYGEGESILQIIGIKCLKSSRSFHSGWLENVLWRHDLLLTLNRPEVHDHLSERPIRDLRYQQNSPPFSRHEIWVVSHLSMETRIYCPMRVGAFLVREKSQEKGMWETVVGIKNWCWMSRATRRTLMSIGDD